MRMAMAVWNGRLAPVLDVATEIVVIEVRDRRWSEVVRLRIASGDPRAMARSVLSTGASLLLCGAASRCHADAVMGEGLQLVDFLAGTPGAIADAWSQGVFDAERFAMPGCGRGRGGCGGGGGRGRRGRGAR